MNECSQESFNVGDVVKVKENADKIFTKLYFANKMKKYLGKYFVIKKVYSKYDELKDCYEKYYELEDCYEKLRDCEYWVWANEWLEPAPAINFDNINSSDVLELL